jgi:hypothetical protein
MMSGTTPVWIAATFFWRSGAKGTIWRSILLPLVFSYSATIALSEVSSSFAKPCVHHISAVVAAVLAI